MLKSKIALVTGASRGIGQAIAAELGAQGATIIGTATTEEGANRISKSLLASNIPGQGIVLNVTGPESIEKAFNTIKETFGAPNILINNAGITRDNLMLRMKEEEWGSVINTNLTSIYRVTHICLKDMMKARW